MVRRFFTFSEKLSNIHVNVHPAGFITGMAFTHPFLWRDNVEMPNFTYQDLTLSTQEYPPNTPATS